MRRPGPAPSLLRSPSSEDGDHGDGGGDDDGHGIDSDDSLFRCLLDARLSRGPRGGGGGGGGGRSRPVEFIVIDSD
jgi:hypothetical protein